MVVAWTREVAEEVASVQFSVCSRGAADGLADFPNLRNEKKRVSQWSQVLGPSHCKDGWLLAFF